MIASTEQLAERVGVSAACQALVMPRSSLYRTRKITEPVAAPAAVISPRALPPTEKAEVRQVLNSERFADQPPREVYATLLDEGKYLCSWRTMYRILDENQEVRERRNQLRHPHYTKPELLATQPNQLWSWDITKLLGPTKWTYYYLYNILDVFSRYSVGWMIAERESAALSEELIAATCVRQNIQPGGTAHGGSGCHQNPLASTRLQRQSVFRIAIQDPEISPGLSRTVWLSNRCPDLGWRILPLVQLRASSQRHRTAHACRCSFWKSASHFGSTSTSFARCLSEKP